MTGHEEQASRYWDREVVAQRPVLDDAHPRVRWAINSAVSGTPHDWPLEWLASWLNGRTFRRGLSIGCGSGSSWSAISSTRGLRRWTRSTAPPSRCASQPREAAGRVRRSHPLLRRQLQRAAAAADAYDVVFAHQSLHHVAKLEKLFRAVLRALRPDGLFYLDEYVGPSREQWNARTFATLPRAVRTYPRGAAPRLRLAAADRGRGPVGGDPLRRDPPRAAGRLRDRRAPRLRRQLLAPIFPYVEHTDDSIDMLITAEQELLARDSRPSTRSSWRARNGGRGRRAHATSRCRS